MRQFNQEELVEKIRSERRHMNELYDEISQLKQENANLKNYVKSLKDECISCPENKKNIKQAQIDILNELKKYLHTEDFDTPDERWKPESEFCAIIDKMLKEVQNAENKS